MPRDTYVLNTHVLGTRPNQGWARQYSSEEVTDRKTERSHKQMHMDRSHDMCQQESEVCKGVKGAGRGRMCVGREASGKSRRLQEGRA